MNRSIFLQVCCYACSEPIAYIKVQDGDDIREIPMEMSFVWCKACKDKESKDMEAVK